MSQSFRLAPMSPLIRWMTGALLLIPLVFMIAPRLGAAPPELTIVGGAVAALYASVWTLLRPSRFEVSPEGVRVVFPWRARLLARAELTGCRQITREQFKKEFGRAVRIGAGGLWGGFGWLWTSRRGLIEFYISRTDGFVLLTRRYERSVLISPERPESMVEAARTLLEGQAR